jgi:protocatechuate 3,4-dioxygenase beta subunit
MTERDTQTDHPRLRRREALGTLGGLGLTGVLGGSLRAFGGGTDAAQAAASCVLSPEVTEGPYWIDNSLTRRDIRENRPGLPLELVLAVQNAATCKAIAGADVEIWHCDASGEYSGFDGTNHARSATRYLRGHQKADASGRAQFLTIFPGWYRGRTPHIHVKVHVGGNVVHTGQVFFNEKTTAAVYKKAPYSSHGRPDTSHRADNIFAQAGGARAQAHLARRTGGNAGYRGTITLGVAT